MTVRGRRFFLSLTILTASVCLALGITLPILKLTTFTFWTTEHSLLSTVNVLLRDGQTFLGLVVLVFSILLPITKLLYLLLVSTLPPIEIVRHQRRLRALEWLGKWSMHDVLVLALTIFFIKSQGVYDAASLNGVYFFTAAVMLMILAYAWIRTDGMAAAPELVPVLPEPDIGLEARSSKWRNFALSFLIIVATVFFALGLILPTIRFTTAYVWTNEHSILTIMYALFETNEYFLCAVVFAVSVFFPFLKLFYLLTLISSHDMPAEFRSRSIATMEWLGRYSMTDVMVLALMIFYVNSSGYTEATVLPGVYFFAASALMTILAYGWANVDRPTVRQRRSGSGPAISGDPRVTIARENVRRHA
ncbi:paraquat-inducible protein A [Hyphomicrobium methylovorum]|uniref:paraquat-inducible protein A n=1 Tax=Hyphomicrobium methylovorum TaxID=84 RepID=UPI0015E7E417|nr:paraquat-inducible protein A [Hyphomicrobium methylovorum]MBA2127324.1 paraquat-inducible protein A [Hyphomicrobium methylovorum]